MNIDMNFELEEREKERFEKWLRRVVGRDDRFKHLLEKDYEEERADFFIYFSTYKMSPHQALQEEYDKFG